MSLHILADVLYRNCAIHYTAVAHHRAFGLADDEGIEKSPAVDLRRIHSRSDQSARASFVQPVAKVVYLEERHEFGQADPS